MSAKQNKYLPFLMWFLPLSFFTYQFILRLWPGLMIDQIMEQFSIDASHFGCIAAVYYYGYAGMQIPVAMLLDRYGARYILCIFAIICGLSTLLFSYTDNWYLACLSRFLVGAGSAAGFLSVSKIISEWFTKEAYAKMVGFSFSFGLMGAVYGGKPISLLIERYSWQNVAFVLAIIAVLIGFLSFLVLRKPKESASSSVSQEAFKMEHIKNLLSSPAIWLLGLANFLMVGSLEGFADIWGVPYLMAAFKFSKGDAAQLTSFVFIGMIFGGPLLALCSKKIGDYGVIIFCGLGMAFIFILLLSKSSFDWWHVALLLFVIGIMCCYQVIIFSAGSNLVSQDLLGVTIAFLNCVNMLGGSFFHTVIGNIMDKLWSGEVSAEGIRVYELDSYKGALLIIPLCAFIGSLIVSYVLVKIKTNQLATQE